MGPNVLVVCGPTATGKTALGVALAQRFGGEVVSADSMQLYRGMDVGTAKPTAEEMAGVPHHMIDVAEPGEDWSVSRYVAAATQAVDGIIERGKLPIIVGGTGLYIDSLVAGREFAPFHGGWRSKLQERSRQEGVAALHRELAQVDPERAAKLPEGDEKRIIRALEIWYETGETMTAHDRRSKAQPPRYRAARIGLSFARREDLWERIDRRVDQMMAAGLAEEVRALLRRGVDRGSTAMQAIGYKELTAALEAGAPLDSAVEEVKLRSRQYAKRQLTWFRRNGETRWIYWEKKPDFSRGLQDSAEYMEEFGLL